MAEWGNINHASATSGAVVKDPLGGAPRLSHNVRGNAVKAEPLSRLGGACRVVAVAALLLACGDSSFAPPETDALLPVEWRAEFGEQHIPLHGLAGDADHLYALVDGITAFDLSTGTVTWSVARPPIAPENLVAGGGRVFAASSVTVALSAATGRELWRFTGRGRASAEIALDERALYIGTDSLVVYALDAATGQPLWERQVLPATRWRSAVTGIVAAGDTLFVSVVEETTYTGHIKRGWIIAIEAAAGTVIWQYVNQHPEAPRDAGRHAVAGNVVLVNDLNGGAFIGLDRQSGIERWRVIGPPDRLGAWDPFTIAEGAAYVASNDTYAYRLDPATGATVWKRSLGASAASSAVCGAHLFASAGALHRLDRANGAFTGSLFGEAQGGIGPDWVRSRLLAHDGRIFFVGNRAVYAVLCD